MVYLQVKLCDPCLSALRYTQYMLYINALPFLFSTEVSWTASSCAPRQCMPTDDAVGSVWLTAGNDHIPVYHQHTDDEWNRVAQSAVCNMNRIGPSAEPWGTAQTSSTESDLKMICNNFLPTSLKVVSSCLLQYKPVSVTNFDKLCHKMIKITGLLVFLV